MIMTVFALVLYAFIAAAPVPEETVLSLNWINSLETSYEEKVDEPLIPFELGRYFGYVSEDGRFSVRKIRKTYVSLSDFFWAEYDAQDKGITVKNPSNETVFNIENGDGYPFFLDSRSFMINSEQNSISMLNGNLPAPETGAGNVVWTYDFASTVTCVDAAAGLLLVGTLDGAIELIDNGGRRVYFSEPSGSRVSAIFGCALSSDGKKIAIVSGLDEQRFVLLEQFGVTWRITFHEFLGEGLRRNVYIMFSEDNSKISFERENAVGIYDVKLRTSYEIPLEGEVAALCGCGKDGILFFITAQDDFKKKLIGIKLPDTVMIEAPFSSEDAFLIRKNENIFVGGKTTLASFKIHKK
ncbi:MAG: WD40 repeat domain-containing protein [Spirochaetaceae bacterium]|nr:WD40 repeat domain-containing protein [Spirochaetaceae bacterium]